MIEHKKKFGVYHWDTFDNVTLLVHEFNTKEKAEDWIREHYKGRIGSHGADRVDIVDLQGDVVSAFSVG